MTSNVDKRIIHSKAAIKESFLSLLEKKPVEKMTVKEICDNAYITRSTFYAYYMNEYDLLQKLTQELVEDSFKIVDSVSPMQPPSEIQAKLTELFEFFGRNSSLLKYVSGHELDKNIREMIYKYYDRRFGNDMYYTQSDQKNILYVFLLDGTMGLIHFWFVGDQRISCGKMAYCLERFYSGCINNFKH